MSSHTIRVLNQYGTCVATYENASVDNDLEPPYAIIRDARNGMVIALVPTKFILDIAGVEEIKGEPPVFLTPCGAPAIRPLPEPSTAPCTVTAGCWRMPGHTGSCCL